MNLGVLGRWAGRFLRRSPDTAAALPWRRALEGLNVGVAVWDLERGLGQASELWCRLFGLGTPELRWHEWLAGIRKPDATRLAALLRQAHEGARSDFDLELRPLGRVNTWLALHAEVLERDAGGRPTRLLTTISDASAQHAAGDRQRVSAQLFSRLHEGLLITDLQFRALEANPAYCELAGAARAELLGRVPPWLLAEPAGSAPPERLASLDDDLRRHGRWQGDIVTLPGSAESRVLRVSISTMRGASGASKYLMAALSDITESSRASDNAELDALTQLPNRSGLAQRLRVARDAADREARLLVVCHLDLDHFKAVNVRHGIEGGDHAMADIARRLAGLSRAGDTLARLGGDEFALLISRDSVDACRAAVEQVLQCVGEPSRIDALGGRVAISASVGATIYPLDTADAETLLRHADQALYQAKQAGRNGCVFFDPERQRRSEARASALERIDTALARGELCLHYQPKVHLRTGEVLGVEALLRWQHPDQGLIGPAQFLPLIEPTSLGVRVGEWVLDQAVDQLARWHDAGVAISVSVNVSARHLQALDFAPRLEQLLAGHRGALARHLELEVLETAALADIGSISDLMQRCRESGVRFSLDDFGTGYSNLSYLKRLPVDVLKVDRSFVLGMLRDPQDQAIVEGVIALARSFGCGVVAEGVETVEQARRLIALGCEWGQGLGIAAPMAPEAVPSFVREHRAMLGGPQRVLLAES